MYSAFYRLETMGYFQSETITNHATVNILGAIWQMFGILPTNRKAVRIFECLPLSIISTGAELQEDSMLAGN